MGYIKKNSEFCAVSFILPLIPSERCTFEQKAAHFSSNDSTDTHLHGKIFQFIEIEFLLFPSFRTQWRARNPLGRSLSRVFTIKYKFKWKDNSFFYIKLYT